MRRSAANAREREKAAERANGVFQVFVLFRRFHPRTQHSACVFSVLFLFLSLVHKHFYMHIQLVSLLPGCLLPLSRSLPSRFHSCLSFVRSIAWLFLDYFAWTLTANCMTQMQYSFTFKALSASLGPPPLTIAPYRFRFNFIYSVAVRRLSAISPSATDAYFASRSTLPLFIN